MRKYDKQYYNRRKQLNKLNRELQSLGLGSIDIPAIPKRKTQGSINRINKLLDKYRNKEYKIGNTPTTLKEERARKRNFEREEKRIKEEIARKSGNGVDYLPVKEDVMFYNLIDIINKYPSGVAKSLQKMLTKQIEQHGINNVISALDDIPYEYVAEIQKRIEKYEAKSGDSSAGVALHNLQMAITSEIPKYEDFMNLPDEMA